MIFLAFLKLHSVARFSCFSTHYGQLNSSGVTVFKYFEHRLYLHHTTKYVSCLLPPGSGWGAISTWFCRKIKKKNSIRTDAHSSVISFKKFSCLTLLFGGGCDRTSCGGVQGQRRSLGERAGGGASPSLGGGAFCRRWPRAWLAVLPCQICMKGLETEPKPTGAGDKRSRSHEGWRPWVCLWSGLRFFEICAVKHVS